MCCARIDWESDHRRRCPCHTARRLRWSAISWLPAKACCPAGPRTPNRIQGRKNAVFLKPLQTQSNFKGGPYGRRNPNERKQMPGHERRSPTPVVWHHGKPALVAQPVESEGSQPELSPHRSDGRSLQLRGGLQDARPRCRDGGPQSADDRITGLVAGGLWPLRPLLHPDGMAQRGHLPGP